MVDEIYQAILRANLRTNDPITKNAPPCKIFIRTSLDSNLYAINQKLKEYLERLLVGANISKWEMVDNSNVDTNIPSYMYILKEELIIWSNEENHQQRFILNDLIKRTNLDFTYTKTNISKRVELLTWLAHEVGMTPRL